MANSGSAVHQRSFRCYFALVLAGALLFSSLMLSGKAQERQDSKSLDVLLTLLKEADALTKDEGVRSELKKASEAVLRALKGGEGSKEAALEVLIVRDLLLHIADSPRDPQGSAFQEKIASALKLAKDSYSPPDPGIATGAKKQANGTAEVVGPIKTQQPDISTIVQEGLRRAQEDSALRAQGQAATTIRSFSRRATAIAAGDNHTCVINWGGEVRCWGNNQYGQLGDGTTVNHSTPVAVDGISGATAIAAASTHTCAIVSGGEVRCWGKNQFGQLGDGTTTGALTPVAVSGLSGATAIAAGAYHTCAIVSGGEVRCWGNNDFAQLGIGSNQNIRFPVPVFYFSGATWRHLSGATAIAAGLGHTCAIVSGGEVHCWGNNDLAQLGAGFRVARWFAVAAYGLSGATAIAASLNHTCALVSGGEVRCWGDNENGQLGNGTTTRYYIPVAVPGLSGATAIAAGGAHTCALVSGGEMRCWGDNENGQLGHFAIDLIFYIPVAVSGLSGATTIAAGANHTCAIVSSGEVRCSGLNTSGQLGNGTPTNTSRPIAVIGF